MSNNKVKFIPNNEEDLNRPHNVILKEGQISIILYILEDYMLNNNTSNDPDLPAEIDDITERLETVIDKYYEKQEEISNNPYSQIPSRY